MKQLQILLALLFAANTAGLAQRLGNFALGVVDTLHSKELGETRRINIYLSEGYSPDSAARYPVIYLLDGSADEDFIHVAGLVQFCNFPWVNVLRPAIVVGIANVDRQRDFTFPPTVALEKWDLPRPGLKFSTAGGSGRFIAFVERELQPYIERNYKVGERRMLIGQSLGGLLATEILLKKPHLFSHFVIVSPSLWWDKESLLIVPRQFSEQKPHVFIAVGKEGKVMEGDARRLFKILKKDSAGQFVSFEFLGKRDHATILHEAVYKAFEVLGKSF